MTITKSKFLLVFLILATAASLLQKFATARSTPTGSPTPTPVIVELFTSEGCSSCPPADQLLSELESKQPFANAQIIALEEHVDYWNSPGWLDPFSSHDATIRQYAYATILGNDNAYTPQMVVDGQQQFVGSREQQAKTVIQQAAGKPKPELLLTTGKRDDVTSAVRIQVAPIPAADLHDPVDLWLVISESGLHSNVQGGENAGEDLHHASVVRKMWKIAAPKDLGAQSVSIEQRVTLDRHWNRENTRVVAFVQNRKTKKILSASIANL